MPELKSSPEVINRLMGGDYPPRDHRREAAAAIEQADHMRSGDPITTTLLATANADAILALVEATERQTEQLRIGNLIAYVVKLSSHPTDIGALHEADVADVHTSVDLIRGGLGLA